MILPNEFEEHLSSDISVICSKSHGFGSDAILLADFAECKKYDTACDLGTGCGIIPLIWCSKGNAKSITAVDIQPLATSQLTRAIEKNNLNEKINVITADLKLLKGTVPFGSFDLVTMNPPYKSCNTGILSDSEADKIARHEILCDIYDICNTASKLLKHGGRFCLCNRPERLCDVIDAMRKYGIEPKRIRFVSKNYTCAPWLFLIEGKKGSKPFIKILPQLYMHDLNGNYSEELIRIIGKYREEKK